MGGAIDYQRDERVNRHIRGMSHALQLPRKYRMPGQLVWQPHIHQTVEPAWSQQCFVLHRGGCIIQERSPIGPESHIRRDTMMSGRLVAATTVTLASVSRPSIS